MLLNHYIIVTTADSHTLSLVMFAEILSQCRLLDCIINEHKAQKTLLTGVDAKIQAKAILNPPVKVCDLLHQATSPRPDCAIQE
jgi:hypothetical protein